MMKKFTLLYFLLFLSIAVMHSCSKSDPGSSSSDPCTGKTIVISGTVTPTSAPTATNGVITATASGSTSFTYNINNGAYQSSGTFNNLAAGDYTIGAKDGAGCIKTKSFTVTATACPTINVTATVTAATTATATDGAISATASGSTGFTYSINAGPFQASGNFTSLAVGSYTITAKDANGCTGSASFLVASAACPTITVSTTVTPSSGPTATNGSIVASASGGTASYVYSIDGGTTFQASGTFNNLTAANYTIVAKDANNCLGSSGTVVVSFVPCPTISISALVTGSDKCSNITGTISVTASGSSGFSYRLNSGAYQASSVFNALGTGNYTIGVKDQNGCTSTQAANVPIAAAGTKFSAVKAILSANCALSGCHSGATPQNGINFGDDCTIVTQKDRIKSRAVDGNPSFMPPTGGQLSASDKQKIVDWINAGGQHSNN